MALHQQHCIPCQGGVPPLDPKEQNRLAVEVPDWAIKERHHLERNWEFPDFKSALDFLNQAGALCEERGHHADFEIGWGRVRASIWTHKIDGLTHSDFVLAAKIDLILPSGEA